MNKIQIFVIVTNSILFSILNYPDEIAITYITVISFFIWMFCLKIKPLLEWTQTKFFHYAQFTLLFFSFFFIIQFKLPSNLMVSLSILFMLGIIYITIDILAFQEYIKIDATSIKDSYITCINCGKNNKNPISDVCSKCGESLSTKINIVKCVNCRIDNKNPISDVCSECGESLSKKVKKVKCVNCGEKNKNPTTDLCSKCGKSLSIKSSTVMCTNCGSEFDSKESNCPICNTEKKV